MKKIIIPLFCLFSFYSFSQISFTEATGSVFPNINDGDLAFADIDGDGDEDLMITGWKTDFSFVATMMTNDGDGNFTEMDGTPFPPMLYSSMAFADVDGDSDMDLMLSGQTANNFVSNLYINSGDGNYSLSPNSFIPLGHSDVAFADIDGDNDLDLLMMGVISDLTGSVTKLYTNDGAGNFTLVENTIFHDAYQGALAFADIDGDNDQDVLLTGTFGSSISHNVWLYVNDGDGNFSEVTDIPFAGVTVSSVDFADIDGDDDQDVLITGQTSSNLFSSNLYKNDGDGNFTLMGNSGLVPVLFGDCEFADIDLDQDLDLVIVGRQGPIPDETAKLYLNDGTGQFSEVSGLPFVGATGGAVDLADVNGDGDLDIFIAGTAPDFEYYSKLYLNELILSSIQKTNNQSISIYPNPFTNYINLETNSTNTDLNIGLFNSEGKLLSTQNINENRATISTENLIPGYYFLEIKDNNGRIKTTPLVKQ